MPLGLPLRASGFTLEAFGAHFGGFWAYFRGPAPVTFKSDREWGPPVSMSMTFEPLWRASRFTLAAFGAHFGSFWDYFAGPPRSLLEVTGNGGHRRAFECLWGSLCVLGGSLWQPSGLPWEAFGFVLLAVLR